MTTLRASLRALLVAGIAAAAHACGVGDVSGPGDHTGDDDGGGGGTGEGAGTGDGGGTGDGAGTDDGGDASSGEIGCATAYTVTGSVGHAQESAGSCDGSGQWGVTISAPVADADSVACGDAPAGASFGFAVAAAESGYGAQENSGAGGAWTVQMRDQGGSCHATFVSDIGNGASWAINASEAGPGGPLGGVARFERRDL